MFLLCFRTDDLMGPMGAQKCMISNAFACFDMQLYVLTKYLFEMCFQRFFASFLPGPQLCTVFLLISSMLKM